MEKYDYGVEGDPKTFGDQFAEEFCSLTKPKNLNGNFKDLD